MNLQSFNSKKYVLTFFMSTCLLTSSFLSTSAKAASFKDLVSKTPALSGLNEVQQKKHGVATVYKKNKITGRKQI